jgi:hypothetical protein
VHKSEESEGARSHSTQHLVNPLFPRQPLMPVDTLASPAACSPKRCVYLTNCCAQRVECAYLAALRHTLAAYTRHPAYAPLSGIYHRASGIFTPRARLVHKGHGLLPLLLSVCMRVLCSKPLWQAVVFWRLIGAAAIIRHV